MWFNFFLIYLQGEEVSEEAEEPTRPEAPVKRLHENSETKSQPTAKKFIGPPSKRPKMAAAPAEGALRSEIQHVVVGGAPTPSEIVKFKSEPFETVEHPVTELEGDTTPYAEESDELRLDENDYDDDLQAGTSADSLGEGKGRWSFEFLSNLLTN